MKTPNAKQPEPRIAPQTAMHFETTLMHHKGFIQQAAAFATSAFVVAFMSFPAKADLNQIPIQTIQWLTDNSDVIFVTRVDRESRLSEGDVLRVLKGEPQSLVFPLRPREFDGYRYYVPPVSSEIRVRFVRGESELLQEIGLVRPQITAEFSDLRRIVFGVGQYGELILSQRDLLHRVASRVAAGPGTPIPVRSVWPHARQRSGVEAPFDFPLETNSTTYVLIVPFTEDRLAHFLNLLRTGDAIDKQRAVHELKQFDNVIAYSAIKVAAEIEDVAPAFRYGQDGEFAVTAADIRNAANRALKRIDQ